VKKAAQASAPIALKHGDVFISIGAFWNLGYYSDTLEDLRRSGVCVGVYIYDVIPLTHPQFSLKRRSAIFASRFDETMPLFDFGLAISNHTAKEAARLFMRGSGFGCRSAQYCLRMNSTTVSR